MKKVSYHSKFIFERITKTNTNDLFVEGEPFLLKATLNLLLCFIGGGWGAVFIGCFPFSCASDLFAKSDRTATDCSVKNVNFLCLSGCIFHGSSPHFGLILSR